MNDIFYKTITSWLLPKGYVEIYNNHPCAKEREFHFSKNGIRIVCVNAIETYCYFHADILKQPHCLALRSMNFDLLSDNVDEMHQYMLDNVKLLS